MPICESDCVDGAELLITEHGQEYPVTFVSFSDKSKRQKKSHQPPVETPPTPATSHAQKTTPNALKSILQKAKNTIKPVVLDQQSQSALRESVTSKFMHIASVGYICSTSSTLMKGVTCSASLPQAKLWRIEQRLDNIEKELKDIKTILLQNGSRNEEPEVDLTAINADTPYSAALSLLDMMFTQEELRKSLLMKSKKSSRPGLPEDRVRKMIDCLKKKFGANSFDIKVLKRKCNQKCRDVNRSYLRLHDEEGTELMPPRHEEEEKEQQEDKEEEKEEDNEDDEEEDDEEEEEEEEEEEDDDDEKEVEEHFSL
ncbi:hypothetical protein EMCRGX_G010915 [Ephydatia muelleri]|eukprot:Em0006g1391a